VRLRLILSMTFCPMSQPESPSPRPLDRVVSRAQILLLLLQRRRCKVNEMVLSECFIRVKNIGPYRSLTAKKDSSHRFEVPIVLPTIGRTSSREDTCMEVFLVSTIGA
jgi:hypothetical protein